MGSPLDFHGRRGWKALFALFLASGFLVSPIFASPVVVGSCTVILPDNWMPKVQSQTKLLAKGPAGGLGCSVLVEQVPATTPADPYDARAQSDVLDDLRQDGDHILDTKVVPINGHPAFVVLAHKLDAEKKLSLVMEVFFTPGKIYYISATSYSDDPRTDSGAKAFLDSPTFQ